MSQQKTTIKIRKGYNSKQREVIAQEIIDHIIERSKGGKDKKNNSFPSYSKSYTESKNFSIAGKSKSKVNLTLSDEMLNAIKLLKHSDGEITIGFDKEDDRNNDVAEGNIKGTYGQSTPIRGKKRDFLGITASSKSDIQDQYPLKSKKKLSDAIGKFIAAKSGGEDIDLDE